MQCRRVMSDAYVCLQTLVQISIRVGPDVIEVLINEGAVVDTRNVWQMTSLHRAVVNNSIESAEMLIARGASINANDAHVRSVLHVAITWSNLKIVKMLISHSLNIK